MAVNYRTGKVTLPEEVFCVTNLKKLNFEIFEKACIACMTEEPQFRVLFDIPSSEEYILYKGKGRSKSLIQVRNWCGYLTILCTSKNGQWIESSHIGGGNQEDIIREAWKHVCRAKSLINKEFEKVKFKCQKES